MINVAVLSASQKLRRGVLAGLAVVLLAGFAVTSAWARFPLAHAAVEDIGRVLIVACVIGRCWCTLYIGGRKGETLVTMGPYSVCRNPLYFFSFLGAAGVGAQTGSMVVALICTFVTWGVFRALVVREEAFLLERHGEAYAAYLRSTPRFVPNPILWRPVECVEVIPRRVVATFLDAMLFVAAIPVIEGFEKLQEVGWLPVLLNLP